MLGAVLIGGADGGYDEREFCGQDAVEADCLRVYHDFGVIAGV